jgi:type I restriction enzyme, S subunit
VYRPQSEYVEHVSYFNYLLRSAAYKWELQTRSKGVWLSRLQLSDQAFLDMPIVVPTSADQLAIVRFLDFADRRIARYILAKRRLIKLLEEQRQAIIHHAVTHGPDQGVRLRSSGIASLDDVPKHWKPVRLKQVATVQTGLTLGKNYGSQTLVERPYLRVANVQAGRLNLSKITTVGVPMSEAKATTLRAGDVLMTEGGDIDKLGRGCIWHDEIMDCLHQNHIFAVRPKMDALLAEYLVALMASPHGRHYFETTAKKTTNLASTNSTTLGNFPLRLPGVEEQRRILGWIAEETSSLDLAQSRAKQEIDLLREFRTRLLADVVTGKRDVREAAANLPDKPVEPVTPDLAEVLEGEDVGDQAQEAVEVEAEA